MRLRQIPAYALCLLVLFAPACSMVDSWTGVATAEKAAADARASEQSLALSNRALKVRVEKSAIEAERLAESLTELETTLEQAQEAQVAPEVVTAMEESINALAARVELAEGEAAGFLADQERTEELLVKSQRATAFAEGRAAGMVEQFNTAGNVVSGAATIAGGPGAGAAAQGVVGLALLTALSAGRIKSALKGLGSQGGIIGA